MQILSSDEINPIDAMDEATDKTAAITAGEGEGKISKNAQKKADKQARLEEGKANKSSMNTVAEIGKSEAKKATNKQTPKSKKIEGAALIGIDVARENDFSGWYQQVLTKGEFLDYYDVSGCYILKVGAIHFTLDFAG